MKNATKKEKRGQDKTLFLFGFVPAGELWPPYKEER
jgi:hypothetical protein